jgi:predicted amidohydrolase YtcJ
MSGPGALDLLFEDVEVDGRPRCRVGVSDGRVAFVDDVDGARQPDVPIVDGAGGALLPGLHDHHLHLMALAARAQSVPCGPPEVADVHDLTRQLRTAAGAAPPGTWVRGTGYDETATGPLDALTLDRLLGQHRDVPVRVQHRTGHQWVLNGAAVALVGDAEGGGAHEPEGGCGVYLDDDERLRARWGTIEVDVGDVSRRLAALGVTGVADATATNGRSEVEAFERAQASGDLRQRLRVLGRDLPARCGPWLTTGARKLVLAEHELPALDELEAEIAQAGRRGVAIHCASRETVVLAAVALAQRLDVPGRLEHASVAPPDVVELVQKVSATVVTQPGFVREHGDRYLREVPEVDRPWLYRLQGWRRAGVRLAAGSDGPFGNIDPWAGMRAAVERTTAAGRLLGPEEALDPESARDLYLAPLDDPGGPPRRVVPGAPADLCLLSVPWRVARADLSAVHVRSCWIGGVACG